MRNLISAIAVSILAAACAFPVAAAELATQKNSAGGVTVDVTPQNLVANAKSWDFKVVLDTHSGELKDDLTKSTVLVVDGGTSYTPTAWQGDPPGGHHREGVLKFKPVSPAPAAIELQIRRAGEANPRSFRWQLK